MRRGRRAPRQEGSRPSGRGGHLRSQWVASPASADPRVRAGSTLQDAALGGGGSAGGSTDPPAGSEAQYSGCLFGGDPGKTQRTGAGARGTLASLTRLGSRGGEWAAVPLPLGGGGGAQTKGACAFKAGSPGAGGEGTSGSGVEGGCAGQQGRGRGPEALRRGGRDSRDARARSRTAGRPAGRPEPAGAAGRRPRAGADPGQVSAGERVPARPAKRGLGSLDSLRGSGEVLEELGTRGSSGRAGSFHPRSTPRASLPALPRVSRLAQRGWEDMHEGRRCP